MRPETKARIEAERKVALDAYVKRVVDEFPPLTLEQRDRLALLLRPTTDEASEVLDYQPDPSGADALTEMLEK